MDPGAAELAVRQLHGAEFGGYKLMVYPIRLYFAL